MVFYRGSYHLDYRAHAAHRRRPLLG
ncbi:hypothetical protein [Pseudarthrobacter sp. AL20]